jgi:Putative auto-transporter adhesin, head GIN domain
VAWAASWLPRVVCRAVVHADSNLINHVTTSVVAGTLVIGDTGRFTARGPMSVDVSVPSLTALSLSGSGQQDRPGRHAHGSPGPPR